MSSIFIFGASGFFGSLFADYFRKKNFEVFDERVDICDYFSVYNVLNKNDFDFVLNCAGITGRPNVDWCEKNRAETTDVNICGSLNIARACEKLNKKFVHVGSGCVYSGNNNNRGFCEEDEGNFFSSFYSQTKLVSENVLKKFDALQLRVRIPLTAKSCSKNIINKLLSFDKISNEQNSYTVIEDFIPASYKLITRGKTGIFNMTNVGFTDNEFIIKEYLRLSGKSKKFDVISGDCLDGIVFAKRSNCVLNCNKRENLGIKMPDIKMRVTEIMKKYVNVCS